MHSQNPYKKRIYTEVYLSTYSAPQHIKLKNRYSNRKSTLDLTNSRIILAMKQPQKAKYLQRIFIMDVEIILLVVFLGLFFCCCFWVLGGLGFFGFFNLITSERSSSYQHIFIFTCQTPTYSFMARI